MSQAADLTARETEVIRIVRVLHSHSGKFVVIGGYAVSALASHRLSVDCDIVISEKNLESFGKVLTGEGYRKARASNVGKGTYGAKTVKYVKLIGGRRVSVDLSINSVVCRDTGGEWSYELLMRSSTEANVVGVTDSTMAMVPKKELLIAMKLHPARNTDMRDIVMLGEQADWNAVADFTNTGTRAKLAKQLDSGINRLGSKEFPSSLKAEFRLRIDIISQIKLTLEHLKTVKGMLAGKGE